MPSRGNLTINNFVGGIITEASPLTFPQNASLDESNFRLDRNGTRARRLGIDYEDGHRVFATGLSLAEMQRARMRVFHWPTPSGFTEVSIGVVQVAGSIFFVDLATTSPSNNVLNGGEAFITGLPGDIVMNFSIVNNKVVASADALEDIFIFSYDLVSDTVSFTSRKISIRDLYGVEDIITVNGITRPITIDERPTTLTNNHKYNLRNQGWSEKISIICEKGARDAIECTFERIDVYPSNSDIWTLGKITSEPDITRIDLYDPEIMAKNSFSLGQAPKGRYIIDLYDRGKTRSEKSGVAVDDVDRETGRISTIESYAGRMFYSGIKGKIIGRNSNSLNLSSAVLYTQVIQKDDDIGKCYQEADATSS